MTKCQECRKTTGGCKNGQSFKESQGCYGPKQFGIKKRHTIKK